MTNKDNKFPPIKELICETKHQLDILQDSISDKKWAIAQAYTVSVCALISAIINACNETYGWAAVLGLCGALSAYIARINRQDIKEYRTKIKDFQEQLQKLENLR